MWLVAVVAFLSVDEAVAQRTMAVQRYKAAGGVRADSVAITRDTTSNRYLYVEMLKAKHIDRDEKRAILIAEQILERDSSYSPAHYELAKLRLSKTPRVALLSARRAYESDSTNAWYADVCAEALVYSSRYDEAIDIYERLVELKPNEIRNYYLLAVLLSELERSQEALEVIDKAETRFGRIEALSQLKLRLLLTTKQLLRAELEAQRAYNEEPSDESRERLIELYKMNEKDSLVEQLYIEDVRRDSTNVEYQRKLAQFYIDKGDNRSYFGVLKLMFNNPAWDFDSKIVVLERLVGDNETYYKNVFDIAMLINTLYQAYPTEQRIVDILGGHYIYMGEVDKSLNFYKQHLSDVPPVEDYYIAVIDISEYLGQYDSVRHYTKMAMRRFPKSSTLYIHQGANHMRDNDLMGCIESFKRAEQYATNDTLRGEILGYIGDIYQQVAERRAELDKARIKRDTARYPIKMSYQKAMQKCYLYYDLALEHHYDNSAVLNNYAYFLSLENRELERAAQMAQRAVELDRNASNLDTYAWILHLQGDDEQAQRYMRQALSLDSEKSAVLQLHYGDILYSLGKYMMAKSYWERAREYGADSQMIEQRLLLLKETPK